jgi:hypothetical protein
LTRLHVTVITNLVDGAVLSVAVVGAGGELLSVEAVARQGRFAIDIPAVGEVVRGEYSVVVRFAIEAQPAAIRDALGYEPRSLMARSPLTLPLQVAAAATTKDEMRALVDALNQLPRDKAVLDDLDRRAVALGERLWIADQRAAIGKFRLALEEARRPQVRRREFDRLLLEAHSLAGL